jgi:negative regulator of flagellin synthesis FlgM
MLKSCAQRPLQGAQERRGSDHDRRADVSSKINGLDGSRPASPGAGRVPRRSQASSGGSAGEAVGAAESVHITDTAAQLAALERAVRDLPAVDESRVAALRTAIEQGAYTVSPDRIADQLMQLEQSLDPLSRRGE